MIGNHEGQADASHLGAVADRVDMRRAGSQAAVDGRCRGWSRARRRRRCRCADAGRPPTARGLRRAGCHRRVPSDSYLPGGRRYAPRVPMRKRTPAASRCCWNQCPAASGNRRPRGHGAGSSTVGTTPRATQVVGELAADQAAAEDCDALHAIEAVAEAGEVVEVVHGQHIGSAVAIKGQTDWVGAGGQYHVPVGQLFAVAEGRPDAPPCRWTRPGCGRGSGRRVLRPSGRRSSSPATQRSCRRPARWTASAWNRRGRRRG